MYFKLDTYKEHIQEQLMRKVYLFLLLFFFAQTSFSQELRAYRDSIPNGFNFWVYLPQDSADIFSAEKKWPVIIYLHGRSLSGDSLGRVLKYGTLDALKHGRVIDAIVIAPQVPKGKWWIPDKIINVLNWVNERFPTDTNRVYALGMSMGGYGTMDLAAAYPNKIAAAMPLCGGYSNRHPYKNLSLLPLWIMHGTADEKIDFDASKKVADAIIEETDGPRLVTTWLEGYNHGRLARLFYVSATYDWLFLHSLDEEDRPVHEPFDVTEDVFDNAYKGFDKGFWSTVKIIDPLGIENQEQK